MQTERSRINELKQTLNMVIYTLYNLNGIMPSASDLYHHLGSEYAIVIEKYSGSFALNFA